MAGAVGVNPLPLTLRELSLMRRGKEEIQWPPFAHLLSLVANIVRDKKSNPKPFTPMDFMPIKREQTKKVDFQLDGKESVEALKSVFFGSK